MTETAPSANRRWRLRLRAPGFATALLAALLTFTAAARHPQPPDVEAPDEQPADQSTPSPADDLRARGLMAQAILAQGNLDRAREIATAAVEKFPNDAYALVIMARVHLAFAEFNEAGQALYQAVKLDPRLPVAHLELGRLYEAERRMASAKRHYRTAYDLAPNDPAAMLAWARTVVDPIERLALLERYLTLADDRTDIGRRAIENQVELIRRVGDSGHCRLRGDPVATTLKIQEIRSQPGAANRHALKLDINGAGEVRTLVDTGASGVIVTESIARAAKLERLGPNLLLGLGDQGVREGWFARAATLSAQGLVFEDCVVEVIPDDVRENMSTPALMGLDGLYRDFAIRFDFTGGELGLLPLPPLPGADKGRPDPYTYDRKTDALPPGFYPARVFGKDFIVPVILNDRLPSYFLIDSGASTTMMAKRLAERLGPLRTSNMQVFGLSGQVKNVWEAVPVTMNVLGLAQKHEGMLVVDLDGYAGGRAGFNGLLGYTFLQHSILTVDDRNGLVRLELGQVMRTPTRRTSRRP